MDSEDDIHDANDVESLDDDFYSGEAAIYIQMIVMYDNAFFLFSQFMMLLKNG
ncbi:hypothetical protein Hdeb2414_s0008g00298441 [Helianthus debilis subsp. tardiflorus]